MDEKGRDGQDEKAEHEESDRERTKPHIHTPRAGSDGGCPSRCGLGIPGTIHCLPLLTAIIKNLTAVIRRRTLLALYHKDCTCWNEVVGVSPRILARAFFLFWRIGANFWGLVKGAPLDQQNNC